jgi:hypothetical protein
MTDTKHTPGPWTEDPEGLVAVSIEGGDGSVVCDVHGAANDARCEANARLIAAAPEMFEAMGEVQSLLYSADNAETLEMKAKCIRKAFGIVYDLRLRIINK